MPSLIQKYEKQVYITQLKKAYSEVSQALQLYMSDNAATTLTEAGMNSQVAVNEFTEKYFKNAKVCNREDSNKCFCKVYKRLDGTNFNESTGTAFMNSKSYILSNGCAIKFNYKFSNNKILNFHIDINGRKGPNTLGKDRFGIYVYNNGRLDDIFGESANNLGNAPLSKDEREESFETYCFTNGTAGCFGKILNDNWQINYY